MWSLYNSYPTYNMVTKLGKALVLLVYPISLCRFGKRLSSWFLTLISLFLISNNDIYFDIMTLTLTCGSCYIYPTLFQISWTFQRIKFRWWIIILFSSFIVPVPGCQRFPCQLSSVDKVSLIGTTNKSSY